MRSKFSALFPAVLFVALLAPTQAGADDWDFIVAPYVLAPSISGDASLGRVEGADVEIDPGDILENLELGAMLHLEARHSSNFGIYLDYSFMKLGDSASGPRDFINLDADVFQGALEAYGTYRIESGPNFFDLYSGVRWWYIDLEVTATGPRGNDLELDRDESWVDPVIGVRWIRQLSDNFRVLVAGDVGGFGAASDFTWSAMGGVDLAFTDNLSGVLAYRALGVDYDDGAKGSSDRFEYDTITQGPMLGMVFSF